MIKLRKAAISGFLTILIFIIIVMFVYGDQSMISPNLEYITAYFGFGTDTQPMGFLTFTFTLLAAFSMVIFGILTDKYKRKWICFSGSLTYSIFAIATFFIPEGENGYWMFFLARIVNGIGFGAIIPTIFSLIGDLVSKEDRSKGYSFFSIASLLGQGIGMALASILYQAIPDWKLPFMLLGICNLIASLLLLLIKEPSRIGKQTVIDEIKIDKEALVYSYRIKLSDLKEVYKKKSNLWLMINFVDTIPTGIILFLIFFYMSEVHNITPDNTTIILVAILLSTLIGTVVFGGILGDMLFKKGYKKARVIIALIGNVAPIPFVYIALLIPFSVPDGASLGEILSDPNVILMLVLMMIGLFLNGGTNGNWYSTVVDVNLPEHRGTVLATANLFDLIGRAVGPLIGSIIATNYGMTAGMASSIVFWIFLPFFWIPVLKNVVNDMDSVDSVFNERLEEIKSTIK